MILQWAHPYFLQQQQKLCGGQTSPGTLSSDMLLNAPFSQRQGVACSERCPALQSSSAGWTKVSFPLNFAGTSQQPPPRQPGAGDSSSDHHQAASSCSPRPVWDFSVCCCFSLTFCSITYCPKNFLSFSLCVTPPPPLSPSTSTTELS